MVRPRMVDGVPDARGVASIKGYALNRVTLVARRNAALKILRAQRTQILDRLGRTVAGGLDHARALELARGDAEVLRRGCEDDQEFTAMTRAFVERFEEELAAMQDAAVD